MVLLALCQKRWQQSRNRKSDARNSWRQHWPARRTYLYASNVWRDADGQVLNVGWIRSLRGTVGAGKGVGCALSGWQRKTLVMDDEQRGTCFQGISESRGASIGRLRFTQLDERRHRF